jgi:glycosyltransferase involved in cell wall biosynthesis
MTLGLCIVIKNEGRRLNDWLPQVRGLFDDFVAVDTGSTDDTIPILAACGARILSANVSGDDPLSITAARNQGISEVKADWILVLDADETLDEQSILNIRSALRSNDNAFFLTWRNRLNGTVFDDYKLVLFRNNLGISFDGAVHSNTQWSVRKRGLTARLLQGVQIEHSLDEQKPSRLSRKSRLEHYVERDPSWWRYHWFLGYTYFKEGDWERAVPLLRDTCNSLSPDFPVECLNAHVVLTDLNARKGIHDKCFRIMLQAAAFFDRMKDDFEVKANVNLGPWIQTTRTLIDQHKLEEVKAYEFGY